MPLLYPRQPFEQPNYTQKMLSYMSSTSSPPAFTPMDSRVTKQSPCIDTGNVVEVESPLEAIEEAYRLVTSTVPSGPIILRCNLPTWQPEETRGGDSLVLDGVSGVDLYDLRALHEKSLLFVHGLIDKLKAAGFQASYKLTVSAVTSCTLIRIASGDPYTPCPTSQLDEVCSELREKLSTLVKRDRMYIARTCNIPTIVIS